jgi:multiple antibiotic resistance protein
VDDRARRQRIAVATFVAGATGVRSRAVDSSFVQAVIAVIAIANPIGAAPIFLSLTDELDGAARVRAAARVALAVLVILTASALFGRVVLGAFGITDAAFRAAGGLVIVLMGLEMLRGTPTRVQHDQHAPDADDDAILIPLAMPLIAGPGAITTVITLVAQRPGPRGTVRALVAVGILTVVLSLTLSSASWLARVITARGQRIFLRFMGLILVAVGAQLLMTGTRAFFAGP